MRDGSTALQVALYARLKDGLDPVKVYDHVPQENSRPQGDEALYVCIGDDDVDDWGCKDSVGTEQIQEIEIFSAYRGRKRLRAIAAAIYDLLHEQNFDVEDQQLVLLRFAGSSSNLEADGKTYRNVLRYRALLDHGSD